MSLDSDILKIQYEVFGMSPEAIAITNGIPTSHVTSLIEDLNWEQNPLITSTPKKVATATEDFVANLKDKLNVAALLKQEILNPTYTKFEVLLVHKAINIINNINNESPNAAKDLKIVTNILKDLLENNANLVVAKDAVNKTDNKVIVQIMNQVEKTV